MYGATALPEAFPWRRLVAMKLLVLLPCALFLSLPAWCQKDLQADLTSLVHTPQAVAERQVALHLRALSERTHEPSRPAVETFARDLVRTLRSRTVTAAQAAQLAALIDSVFKSAGTSTLGFHEHVQSFQAATGSSMLSAELETIGKQVRGPEDTPVMPAGYFRRR